MKIETLTNGKKRESVANERREGDQRLNREKETGRLHTTEQTGEGETEGEIKRRTNEQRKRGRIRLTESIFFKN